MNILFPPFNDNIRKNSLILPGDKIILGLSGGKDSVTLLYLLQELQKEMDFQLVSAYFNHKLRSDAHREQEWVGELCRSREVKLVIGSKDVAGFKEAHKLNLEHAASISRYHFFQQVSSGYPNAKVATAHTKSDLTETFLIKLFRGSGLQGLTTISSRKENAIIRPLLLFDEEDILGFLHRNGIPYYIDYTNEQDEFLRNRIRHHVVPEIKKIEPGIHQRIFRTVSLIQEEYEYFSGTARDVLSKCLILDKVLPGAILNDYPLAIRRHIIREYLRLLKGNLLNIDFDHIEAVRTLFSKMRGLALPGVELSFHKGYIFPKDFSIPGYSYSIAGPGIFDIPEIRKTITVEITPSFQKPADNNSIITPLDLIRFPLTVRPPFKEDKYIKINTTINQKVIEMIRASGFPSELRNLCPVVMNGNGDITWAAGSPAANSYKAGALKDKKYLKIMVEGRKPTFL